MRAISEQNAQLRQEVQIMVQRLLGEIETGRDINTIMRIAAFGAPVAKVARNGGGYLELFEALEHRIDELDRKLELKLARAGFGPEERLALIPQVRARLLGTTGIEMLSPAHQQSLPGGEV